MNIGSVHLPGNLALAPMAGVTDQAFRVICREMGAAYTVTEMVSAKALCYQDKKTIPLMALAPDESPAAVQLFGSDPAYIAEAARRLENAGFQFFDLNFGCPAPKITGNGEGSAMMRDPVRLGAVVRALSEATSLPVTVKIRAGWDSSSINAPEVARICEDNGAKAVAVHARTRDQQYAGKADWRIIRDVKRAVSVPVFGNGDVRGGADALRMLDETGCDAVIVGRAAQGNPWIFREIAAAMQGEEVPPPTPEERMEMAVRHFQLEAQLYGEKLAVLQMRKHIAWYVHGMKGASRFRERINQLDTAEAVLAALKGFCKY